MPISAQETLASIQPSYVPRSDLSRLPIPTGLKRKQSSLETSGSFSPTSRPLKKIRGLLSTVQHTPSLSRLPLPALSRNWSSDTLPDDPSNYDRTHADVGLSSDASTRTQAMPTLRRAKAVTFNLAPPSESSPERIKPKRRSRAIPQRALARSHHNKRTRLADELTFDEVLDQQRTDYEADVLAACGLDLSSIRRGWCKPLDRGERAILAGMVYFREGYPKVENPAWEGVDPERVLAWQRHPMYTRKMKADPEDSTAATQPMEVIAEPQSMLQSIFGRLWNLGTAPAPKF